MPKVKAIIPRSFSDPSPAFADHKAGIIYPNAPVFNGLPYEAQQVVLLHEEGHIVLNTRNELAADKYAFKQYIKKGLSLKAYFYALSRVLNANNPEHYKRIVAAWERVSQYDKRKNRKNLF